MTAGNYIPVTCAGCRQSILDASFIWTGRGMYHNHCAPRGNVTFGAPFQLPPTEDRLRQIIREELSRALGVGGRDGD